MRIGSLVPKTAPLAALILLLAQSVSAAEI
jgi:hypothetical protein